MILNLKRNTNGSEVLWLLSSSVCCSNPPSRSMSLCSSLLRITSKYMANFEVTVETICLKCQYFGDFIAIFTFCHGVYIIHQYTNMSKVMEVKCVWQYKFKLGTVFLFRSYAAWKIQFFLFYFSYHGATTSAPAILSQPPHPWPLLMLLVRHTLPSAACPGRSYFKVT